MTLPLKAVRPCTFTRALALAGVLLASLAAPAAAQQSVALKVFQDFAADGRIDPCKHTSAELRAVDQNIPPDIDQYAPDYRAAVKGALEARARGDCAGAKPQAAPVVAPQGPAASAPKPAPAAVAVPMKTVVPEPPAPVVAPASADAPAPAAKADVALERVATLRPANEAPAPLVMLAILGLLLVCSVLFLTTMHRFGWEQGRLAPVAHAWREAGWRTEGLWQDFRDWLKLGR